MIFFSRIPHLCASPQKAFYPMSRSVLSFFFRLQRIGRIWSAKRLSPRRWPHLQKKEWIFPCPSLYSGKRNPFLWNKQMWKLPEYPETTTGRWESKVPYRFDYQRENSYRDKNNSKNSARKCENRFSIKQGRKYQKDTIQESNDIIPHQQATDIWLIGFHVPIHCTNIHDLKFHNSWIE